MVDEGGPEAEPLEEDGALVPLEPTNCDLFFQDLGRIGKVKQKLAPGDALTQRQRNGKPK